MPSPSRRAAVGTAVGVDHLAPTAFTASRQRPRHSKRGAFCPVRGLETAGRAFTAVVGRLPAVGETHATVAVNLIVALVGGASGVVLRGEGQIGGGEEGKGRDHGGEDAGAVQLAQLFPAVLHEDQGGCGEDDRQSGPGHDEGERGGGGGD
jgi:hypothetical protein